MQTSTTSAWLRSLFMGAAVLLSFGWYTPTGHQKDGLKEQYRLYFQEYLSTHPYQKHFNLTREEIKAMPKADRPDLANMFQFLRTMDPATGTVPTDAAFDAYRETRRQMSGGQLKAAIAGVNWTERGPDNVGGRTRALMWDPNDPTNRKAWAGGVAGGLWYNNDVTDANSVWQAVNDFWANLAVVSIDYDPANTQTFYVGTGEGFFNADAVRGDGLWKTTDGGATWNQLGSTANNNNFYYCNDIVCISANTLIVGSRTGIHRSTDGGATWTNVYSENIYDLERAADGTLYAGDNDGDIMRSTDNGVSWTRTALSGQRVELAFAPSNANIGYAIADGGSGSQDVEYFKKTTDGGATWTDLPSIPLYLEQGSCAPDTPTPKHFTRRQAWYDLILGVHPTNPNTVIAGGVDLHRSTDGGTTWGSISYWTGACDDYVHADQHAIKFRPGSPNEMLVGTDGGVSLTTDVTAADPDFNDRNNGYNVTQYYAGANENTVGSNYFLAGAQDNGTQRYNQAGMNSTTRVFGGDGGYCHVDQNDPTYQVVSYVRNNIGRSTNGGASFSYVHQESTGAFINTTDYDSDAKILYCRRGNNELKRIANFTGTVNVTDLTGLAMGGGAASAIKVSPYTNNVIYIGTTGGRVFRVTNADATPVFTDIDPSGTLPGARINCVQLGSTEQIITVTYSSYRGGHDQVWQTTNGGITWTDISGDLPNMPIYWAVYDPDDDNQMLVATETGVWSCDNINAGTVDWEPSVSNMANCRTDMLQIRTSDKLVSAATHGRGLFTTDVFSDPLPQFAADKTLTYMSSDVVFTDASLGATSWTWNFGAGATPATATGVGPHTVQYTSPGLKTVTLQINGGAGPQEIKTDYIHVLPDHTPPYAPAAGGNFETNVLDFGADNTQGTPFERGSSAIAGKDGTTSPTNAWVTDLTAANYTNRSIAYLYCPNYDFSGAGTYTLRFQGNYDLENNWDGVICQSSTDRGATWTNLGATGGTWYDGTCNNGGAFVNGTPMFTGNSGGYTLKSQDVSGFAGNTDVAFRFVFASDNSVTAPGFAIDDFEILYIPPALNADFTADITTACTGQTVTFTDNSAGATSWNWNFGAGASPATANAAGPHTVTYSTAGAKDVTLSINGGADTETKTAYVNVSTVPTASISTGGASTTICSGGSVTLTASPNTGSETYQWSLNGTPIGGATSASYSASSAGDYTVTVDNGSCTDASAPTTVTVAPGFSANITAATATTFCAGGSVVLSATPNTGSETYQWRESGTPIAGATSASYTATASGDYTVSVDNGTCSDVSNQITVTVNALPTVTLAPLTDVCVNAATVLLSGSPAGGTYSGPGVTGNTFAPNAATAGTHTITYSFTDGNGCTNTATQSVTVNPLPTVTLPAIADVCENAPTTLLPAGSPAGGTYSGTGVTGNTFQATAAGVGTHAITYSFTDGNGCTNSATQNITVNPLPTVTFSPIASVCISDAPFALSATPAGGTFSGTGVTGSNFVPSAAGAGTHTLTYSYTDGNGCMNSATQSITVSPALSATIAAGGSTTLCGGSSVTLTATPGAGVTYQWQDGGANIPGATGQTYTASAAGNYAVVVSNGGCSAVSNVINVTSVASINFYPDNDGDGFGDASAAPVAACTAPAGHVPDNSDCNDADNGINPAAAEVCGDGIDNDCDGNIDNCNAGNTQPPRTPQAIMAIGQSTSTMLVKWHDNEVNEDSYEIYRSIAGGSYTLLAVVPGGSGWLTYLDTGLDPDTQYHYYVRSVKGGLKSTHSDQAEDFTYPETPTLVRVSTLCYGDAAQVEVLGTHDGAYRWYTDSARTQLLKDGAGTAINTASYTTNYLTQSTTLYVTALGHRYESAISLVVPIQVNPRPQAAFQNVQPIISCNGSAQLEAVEVLGSTYRWWRNGTLYAETNVPQLAVQDEGMFSLEVLSANGCAAQAPEQVRVSLNQTPEAEIYQGNAVTFCENGMLSGRQERGVNYAWLLPDGSRQEAGQTTASEAGEYRFIAERHGCADTATVRVEILTFPADIAITGSEPGLCPNQQATHTLQTDAFAGVEYEWLHNGRVMGRTTAPEFTTTLAGTFSVRLVYPQSECSRESEQTWEVVVYDVPAASISPEGQDLRVNIQQGANWQRIQWFLDGTEMTAWENLTSITPEQEGAYQVRVTYPSGCETASRAVNYRITGIETELPQEAKLFPNPNSGEFTLVLPTGQFPEPLSFRLTDQLGRELNISHSDTADGTHRFTISSNLARGAYFLWVKDAEKETYFRFVLE